MALPNGKNNYIQFSFDPYEWLNEGIDIAVKNNLYQERLPSGGRDVSGKNYDWYGYDPTSSKSKEEQFNLDTGLGSFLDQTLIDDVEETFSEISAKIDLGGDMKPSRMQFTSKPIGVFDFGQASKGLVRPVEYYCKEKDDLINSKDILKGSFKGVEYFYYNEKENNVVREIIVQKRQDGTTAIKKNCKDIDVHENDVGTYLPYRDGEIVNSCGKYKLRYASTNKKVYVVREKKGGGIAPYVDLYMLCGQNNKHDPEQMMIQMMPNLLLARVLERSGVRVRIFGVYIQNINSGGVYLNKVFMIKNYGEPIDINKISVFTSDTRFFRHYMWNASTGWNYEMTKNKDYGGSDGSMYPPESYETDIMPLIRNFVDYSIKEGSFPSQVVNKKLMLFGGLNTSSGDKLKSDRTEKRIIEKFNKLLDYVQVQLTKTPREVIGAIIKRKRDKGDADYEIKYYLNSMITEIYSATVKKQTKTPEQLKKSFDRGTIDKDMYEEALRVNIQLDTKESESEILDDRQPLLSILKTLLP
jgi:hypothetical protein